MKFVICGINSFLSEHLYSLKIKIERVKIKDHVISLLVFRRMEAYSPKSNSQSLLECFRQGPAEQLTSSEFYLRH